MRLFQKWIKMMSLRSLLKCLAVKRPTAHRPENKLIFISQLNKQTVHYNIFLTTFKTFKPAREQTQTCWGAGAQTKKKGIHRQNDLSIDHWNLNLASNWLLRNTWNTLWHEKTWELNEMTCFLLQFIFISKMIGAKNAILEEEEDKVQIKTYDLLLHSFHLFIANPSQLNLFILVHTKVTEQLPFFISAGTELEQAVLHVWTLYTISFTLSNNLFSETAFREETIFSYPNSSFQIWFIYLFIQIFASVYSSHNVAWHIW